MTNELTCYACGSRLMTPTPKSAICTNQECPSGGLFSICGFCKQLSFAYDPSKMFCFNRECRMHQVTRSMCSHCNKASVMNVFGKDICINRACPSNAEIIDECFFCHNKSFLGYEDIPVCTKGDCEYLLKIVRKCYFCGERSYVEEESACMNPDCDYFKVKVTSCVSCSSVAKVMDSSHPNYNKCMNPECKGEDPASSNMEMTLDSFTVDDLKQQGADQMDMTMQGIPPLPPEMKPDPPKTPEPEEVNVSDEPTVQQGPDEETFREVPEVDSVRMEEEGIDAAVTQPIKKPMEEETPRAPWEAPAQEAATEPTPAPWEAPATQPETKPEPPAPEPPKSEPAPQARPPWEAASSEPATQSPASVPSPREPEPAAAPPWETPAQEQDQAPFFNEQESFQSDRAPDEGFVEAGSSLYEQDAGGALQAQSGKAGLLEVFEFIREHVLKTESGEFFPIYLLIGLSGAGKTTYLTVLGNILESKDMKYYFPYEGIDIRSVKIMDIFDSRYGTGGNEQAKEFRNKLGERVLDLVYEFSEEHFTGTIAKELWPERTIRDADSTYFLLTDVTKDQKTIARLVTFETSGEDFEDVINAITKIRSPEEAKNPLQRIILELMNYAEGFVILIDPANDHNDNIFSDLFRELRDSIEPRAMNHLYRRMKEVLVNPMDALEDEEEINEDDLKQVIAAQKEKKKAEARRQREIIGVKKVLLDKLTVFKNKISSQGAEAILEDKEGFIDDLQNLAMRLKPDIENALERVKVRGYQEKHIKEFYSGLIDLCTKGIDKLAEKYYEEQEQRKLATDAAKDPSRIDGAMRVVFEQCGIDPKKFRLAPDPQLNDERPVRKFHKLRDLAIVITKSDMYPIVYPPEQYPTFKLPKCKQSIGYLENYIKLIGGSVNYYNASAVGYSILKDTRFYPGAENTLTPINIVEPIFDMLRLNE